MSSQTSTSFMPEKLRILSGSAPEDAGYGDYADRPYRFFSSASLPPAIAPWFQIGSTTYSLPGNA